MVVTKQTAQTATAAVNITVAVEEADNASAVAEEEISVPAVEEGPVGMSAVHAAVYGPMAFCRKSVRFRTVRYTRQAAEPKTY